MHSCHKRAGLVTKAVRQAKFTVRTRTSYLEGCQTSCCLVLYSTALVPEDENTHTVVTLRIWIYNRFSVVQIDDISCRSGGRHLLMVITCPRSNHYWLQPNTTVVASGDAHTQESRCTAAVLFVRSNESYLSLRMWSGRVKLSTSGIDNALSNT